MTPARKPTLRIAAALWAIGFVALLGAAVARAVAEEGKPAPKPVTRNITIDATVFQPASVVVNVGDTIVWTNKDLFKHTVTADGGAFDSKDIPAGSTWSYTVKTAGVFEYACIYHATMRGTLRVR